MIAHLNGGTDANGREIDAPTSFFTGVAVNPAADDLDAELARLAEKVEAGARFAMTQALFDLSYLERMLERLGGTSPIPLLVGVFFVRSHQLALRLHNEVPGIVVPEPVLARLRDAGKDAPAVGRALAQELIAGSRSLAAGRVRDPAVPAAGGGARAVRRRRDAGQQLPVETGRRARPRAWRTGASGTP